MLWQCGASSYAHKPSVVGECHRETTKRGVPHVAAIGRAGPSRGRQKENQWNLAQCAPLSVQNIAVHKTTVVLFRHRSSRFCRLRRWCKSDTCIKLKIDNFKGYSFAFSQLFGHRPMGIRCEMILWPIVDTACRPIHLAKASCFKTGILPLCHSVLNRVACVRFNSGTRDGVNLQFSWSRL